MDLAVKKFNSFNTLRALTEEEIEKHHSYSSSCVEARNRFTLFRNLEANYLEWESFVKSLLDARRVNRPDDMDELNRLLLNYLTFAYSIREHFKVSYRRMNRKNKPEIARYEEFIKKLCSTSRHFAFILDFRGYFQHVGLGISNFKRNVNKTSVTIQISADPKSLIKETKEWKLSNLLEEDPDICLVESVQEFHIHMTQSYAAFVARAFYPIIDEANSFYNKLTLEATKRDPNSKMIFITNTQKKDDPSGSTSVVNIQYEEPPNHLFAELGIQINS